MHRKYVVTLLLVLGMFTAAQSLPYFQGKGKPEKTEDKDKEKKKDGKEVKVIYVFIDKGGKEPYHKEVCTTEKAGSVKGVVSKKKDTGEQLFITPAKDSVKFDD